MLVYFEIVDIPIEGFYEDEKLDFFAFFCCEKNEAFCQTINILAIVKLYIDT